MRRLLPPITFYLLLLTCLAPSPARAQGTTQYPTSLDTDATLPRAADGKYTYLTSAATNAATTIAVGSTAGVPTNGVLQIDSELLAYATADATHFTVTRGFSGTTAVAHSPNAMVRFPLVSAHVNGLQGATLALQAKVGTGSSAAASASAGQVLTKQSGGGTAWETPPAGVSSLDGLSDVAVSSPASGQVLRFDGSLFVNAAIQSGDLPGGIDAAKLADGSVSNVELQRLDGVTSGVQSQLDAKATSAALTAHTSDAANPHAVTKAQVGLANADNTADAAKPVSTAQLAAIDAASAADRARVNHTGTQSADTLTDGTTNKAFTAVERTKLAGVATGATANSSDATLLARANHTGTQTLTTISDAGTAAALNVPASGDAAAGEVVKGNDTRLTNSRTPTAHASSHASAGSDPVTLAQSQVTNLVSDLTGKQPLDATLTSLAAHNTGGLLTQTAADTFTGRTLTAGSSRVTVTNGNGVGGNPTVDLGTLTSADVPVPNLVGARVYNSAALSVANATATALTFNSERFDTAALHDTGSNTDRLVAPSAGYYFITCHTEYASNTTGFRSTSIRVGASGLIVGAQTLSPASGSNTIVTSTALWYLAAGDYVRCFVYQTSGGALNIHSDGSPFFYSPEFSMFKVGN